MAEILIPRRAGLVNPLDDEIDLENPLTDSPLNKDLIYRFVASPRSIGSVLNTNVRTQATRLEYYDNTNYSQSFSYTGRCVKAKLNASSYAFVQIDPRGYLQTKTNVGGMAREGTFSGWLGWGMRGNCVFRNIEICSHRNFAIGTWQNGATQRYAASIYDGGAGSLKQALGPDFAQFAHKEVHLIGTYKFDSSIELYVNGKLASSTSLVNAENQNGFPLNVMRYSDRVASQVDWTGPYYVNDVRVYNRKITETEARHIFEDSVFPRTKRRYIAIPGAAAPTTKPWLGAARRSQIIGGGSR